MNLYDKAISNNQIVPFFRGEGEYFDLDKDWGGHDSGFTKMHIMGYGTDHGETILYQRLEKDLPIFMNREDFDFNDFKLVIGIIWFYTLFRYEENKFTSDWIISKELKSKIRNKYNDFESSKIDLLNINRVISNMEQRFNFMLFD